MNGEYAYQLDEFQEYANYLDGKIGELQDNMDTISQICGNLQEFWVGNGYDAFIASVDGIKAEFIKKVETLEILRDNMITIKNLYEAHESKHIIK